MIDINLIRKTPDVVRENIKKKFQDDKLVLVDEVIELDVTLTSDTELMNAAFLASKKLILSDPELVMPEHKLIKKEVLDLIVTDFSTIS